jgi:hypothetical protein
MKYLSAGLTAIVALFTACALQVVLEEPVRELMGWQSDEPYTAMNWLRAGAGLTVAVLSFWLVVQRRNNAAKKWRKELAARARA